MFRVGSEDSNLPGAAVSCNLLARAPQPGRSKTRLIAALGAEGAADAHAVLLTHVAGMARHWCSRSGSGRLFRLWVTPDETDPFFATVADSVQLRLQPEGDLGVRLDRIARCGLAEAGAVLLLGGDAVSLDSSALDRAAEALLRHPAVLIPAADGGYVLLGLTRHAPQLFAAIPWGSGQVAEATRRVFQELGWSWEEIPGHWDVDRLEDWERFRGIDKNLVQ
ncbi:MAG: TIGR04282 family arsenosugar biosynthesis glycosyltransferase [Magnetococcales bacterium]|nr:TIGR04282 family arsenosugar biosynthesis glycosyltransferase [Magnetococcales bacterium]